MPSQVRRISGAAGRATGLTWQAMAQGHDASGLASERNILRHRPLPAVHVYVADDADQRQVEIARLAQRVSGVPADLTVRGARVRVIGSVGDRQLADWYAMGVEVDHTPVVADAALELRHWVREQAVSHTRHRHGRLLD